MWTHKHPYRPSELSMEYIQERGEISLFRALNIKRVVGFIGSGVSVAYGRPTWSQLVRQAVATAKMAYSEYEKNINDRNRDSPKSSQVNKYPIQELHRQLEAWENISSPSSEENILAIGLSEQLVTLLGDKYKNSVRIEYANSLYISRKKALEVKSKIYGNFHNTMSIFFHGKQFPRINPAKPEPFRTMIKSMDINRYATLNFDVEIEREFQKQYRTSNVSSDVSLFDQLCHIDDNFTSNVGEEKCGASKKNCVTTEFSNGRYDDSLNRFPCNVDFHDGQGRTVNSVCLDGDNIGELVNFSLFARQYDAQVFHLHGRCDRPRSMVLTEEDYKKTYFRSGEHNYTFDEALESLFQGNDILFVGVGMSEPDTIRPLRQFLSSDKYPDYTAGRVYQLRERTVKFSLSEVISSYKIDKIKFLKEFASNYLCEKSKFDFPARQASNHSVGSWRDYLTDSSISLTLHGQYGISTIFYGDSYYRQMSIAIRLLQSIYRTKDNDLSILKDVCPIVAGTLRASSSSSALLTEEVEELIYYLLDNIEYVLYRKNRIDRLFESARGDWESFFEFLATDIRSSLLNNTLIGLSERKANWWRDWKSLPGFRATEYTKTYHILDSKKRTPLVSRHRMEYPDQTKNELSFDGIEDLIEDSVKRATRYQTLWDKIFSSATFKADETSENIVGWLEQYLPNHQRIKRENYLICLGRTPNCTHPLYERPVVPKRIIRYSMQRGHGKGTLTYALQQDVQSSNFKQYDQLFQTVKEPTRYHGAFFASVGFSMEFASVLDALNHFVLDALAGLYKDYGKNVVNRKKLKEFEFFPGGDLAIEVSKLEAIRKTVDISPEISEKVRRYQNLDQNERSHRLTTLRLLISAYTYTSICISNRTINARILICLNGLDKLCDSSGLPYNPMYRAFFRLLSGHGLRYLAESNPFAPIDLVFINGNPEVPTWYLSKQFSEKEIKHQLTHAGGPYSSEFSYRPHTQHQLYLSKWKRKKAISLLDRNWMNCNDNEKQFNRLIRSTDLNSDYSELSEMLKTSVALHGWVSGVLRLPIPKEKPSAESVRDGGDELLELIVDPIENIAAYASRLNTASSQTTSYGVIEVLVAELKLRISKNFSQIFFTPVKGQCNKSVHLGIDLTQCILSHLALFPMPIPLRVLYGCSEIYQYLIQLQKLDTNYCSDKPRHIQREQRLKLLNSIIHSLFDTRLVIKISPKQDPSGSVLLNTSMSGLKDYKADWRIFSTRYTLQHQLREYFAHKMGLSVPDQGERNFYQLTLYCDQPRDLPTPSSQHYALFRRIITDQIKQCRHTLWCFYKLKAIKSDPKSIPNGDKEIAYNGLIRRLYDHSHPGTDSGKSYYDPTLNSIHAVQQRTRAIYGLLRSGFSIGTLSRLPGFTGEDESEQPFERHRGWLRGVTNAALGIDYVSEEIEGLAKGELLDLKNFGDSNEPEKLYNPFAEHFGKQEEQLAANLPNVSNPLYRDEVGWLYNERAVVSFTQGNLFDAIPLFRQAKRVLDHSHVGELASDPALHAAVRRVNLNLAIAQIERANLNAAKNLIDSLLIPTDFSGQYESMISWIGKGYLGLIRHLNGDFATAAVNYNETIDKATESGLLRLASIFNRHYADLLRSQGQYPEANIKSQFAVSSALQSEQRDIFWLARLSQAHIWLAENRPSCEIECESTVKQALRYAKSMGIIKIEIEALRIQAEILLRNGDQLIGGAVAAKAAALAARHGLRLFRQSALLVYAKSLVGRQQYTLAYNILKEVRRESERRQYLSLASSISALFDKIPQKSRSTA